MSSLAAGRTVSHYRILEQIGEGGMGIVYRAWDERLERDVALKVLPPGVLADDGARRRFRKEALALSKLNHPNIQTVHDFDTMEGLDFLVTEYVPGVTLSDLLARGALVDKQVSSFGGQLADGLSAAHGEGIVHRDLKPSNLRVTPDGRLKILDFGLAQRTPTVIDAASTRSVGGGVGIAGTLPYMAPEQLRGETVDARTDVFAAGCVLYEMCTGRRAFAEELAPRLTDAILHAAPPSPSSIKPRMPAELERIILKCLEKDPPDRYQSAIELGVDLRRLESGRVGPPFVSAHARRSKRAVSWTAGVATAALVAGSIALGAARWRAHPPRGPHEAIRSLAVLPLANLSGDPQQDYFVDGMHEALITDLAQIGALRVISRTSVMQYKTKPKPLPEIGRELDVDAVIEGSVARSGDRVRVTAQLIDAATDRHLWAKSYDRDLRNVLSLQNEVASAIASEIQVKLTASERERLGSAGIVDPTAYEAVLKGQHIRRRGTGESFRKSIEYFNQAVALDPRYADAYADLAQSYNQLTLFSHVTPGEGSEKAKAAALKALELDASNSEAHFGLGSVLFRHDRDWAGAEREYRRAIELKPNDAMAHFVFSVFLTSMRRFDEAIEAARRSAALDPLSADSNLGWNHFMAGRYGEALAHYKKAVEVQPTFWVQARLAAAYSTTGKHAEGMAACDRIRAAYFNIYENVPTAGVCAWVYGVGGREREARKVVDELEALSRRAYVDGTFMAAAYVGVGETDKALAALERAYDERSHNIFGLRNTAWLAGLRSAPRFQALVRRMNFPS